MSSKLWCFLGVHEYAILAAFYFNDVSWGEKLPSTTYTLRCSKCGVISTETIYGGGHWELKKKKGL